MLETERGLAGGTCAAYARDLASCGAYLAGRGLTWLTVAPADLGEYLREQSAGGAASRTVARRLAALSGFVGWLAADGVRPDAAALVEHLDAPKIERSLPRVLNRAQVAALVAAPAVAAGSPLHPRDVAILELLYACGLRASELCGLGVRDVGGGSARVVGKGSKERIVPIGGAAAAAVLRYLADCRPRLAAAAAAAAGDRLFLSRSGRPLRRGALWGIVERHGRAALGRDVSPHVLRHCFASHLLGGGADLRVVQELLGHADVGTTQIYTHVDASRLKALHARFHPRR